MHNAIQPTIIHNLFFLHGIRLVSDPRSLPLPSSAPPPGRSISTPPGATPLVRRPILLIEPPLYRVKPSADRSSLSDRHRHWPPTQLHSHHRRRPHRHRVVLGRLSRIGRLPLHQIHTVVVPIRLPLPDPPAALITPPPHRSGRSCADLPPPQPQSIPSTTAMSLLFERMRDQRPRACAWIST
jgi:hypothetical protein